jgi:hypothetical protein
MQHWAKYVVEEVDLVSYFDSVNWTWLRRFVRHRVNDGGLIRLLNKWLKAGVMENGLITLSDEGVPEGTSGTEAQRLLPVFRTAPVRDETTRRPQPSPIRLGAAIAPTQPESQATE